MAGILLRDPVDEYANPEAARRRSRANADSMVHSTRNTSICGRLTLSAGLFYICSHTLRGQAMSSQAMSAHAFFHLQESENSWHDPDLSVLDDRRGPVPAVPLGLLPLPWRDWIADTERATGAPADYVLPSVLAGVVAVCGAGVRVRVTPAWDEPLVLWQAVVGEPSTGKSAALAPM